MDLKDFLAGLDEKPSNWAKRNGIDPATLSRFLRGKQSLLLDTAQKIVEASAGQVSYQELARNNDQGECSPPEA